MLSNILSIFFHPKIGENLRFSFFFPPKILLFINQIYFLWDKKGGKSLVQGISLVQNSFFFWKKKLQFRGILELSGQRNRSGRGSGAGSDPRLWNLLRVIIPARAGQAEINKSSREGMENRGIVEWIKPG